MGDAYKISDKNATYFVTMTIVEWIDIFARNDQKQMIVDSLQYCQKEKGLTIYAWCLMPNHLHIICSVSSEVGMSGFLRDFKKFTSKKVVKLLKEEPGDSRNMMLRQFENACKHLAREQEYKVWQDSNHAMIIFTSNFFYQKLNYIHNNPVAGNLVAKPEDYMFSSARNYADLDYLLEVFVEPQQLITIR